MKKLLIILTLSFVFVMALSGCAGGDTTGGGKVKGLSEAGEFPLVEKTATITMLSQEKADIKDILTNEFTVFYEEKTNVHVDWELIPSSSLAEKRSLTLASGDYPEVFFGVGITKEEEMTYGPEGVFLPLEDLIQTWGVETKKMFAEVSYIEKGITTPDGHIYTLPQVNECFHCIYSQKHWINTSWLTTLGLDIPTTTDEYYTVLKAFKEQDPNGNGKADEIPLSGSTNGWHANPFDFISNAWLFNDGGDRLIVEDGVVDTVVNRDEFRDALRYSNMLYNEGLLDEGAFTQDQDILRQVAENPDVELLGVAAAGWFGVFTTLEGERNKIYDVIPPLEGPDGVQYSAKYPYTYGTGQYAITNKAENPALAMKWADWLYTLDAALLYIEAGREGFEWSIADEGQLDFHGNQARWQRIDTTEYGEIQNVHYYQMGPSWRSMEYRQSWATPQDIYDPKGYEVRLFQATELYVPYAPDTSMVYPPTYADADTVNEMSMLQTAVNDLTKESIARFITGDLDIEADWDKYLKDLETAGLTRYLEIKQTAYDAVWK